MASLSFLDQLLRRGGTIADDLANADRSTQLLRGSFLWLVTLGALYGFAMGSYNGFLGQSWLFAASSALKVPLLLVTTTLLCFPALYVFGIAGGAAIRPQPLLAALFSAQAVLVLALVALIPVVLFFTTTIHGYKAVKLLHVAVFALAGLSALRFLRGVLQRADPSLTKNRRLMIAWMALFGLTGAQMGWMMRPFIGRSGEDFVFARQIRGSIFQDIGRTLLEMVGGM